MNFYYFKLNFKLIALNIQSYFKKINHRLAINNISKIDNSIIIFFPIDENQCKIASYKFNSLNDLSEKGIEVNICLSDKYVKFIESINCNKYTYIKNGFNIKKLNNKIDFHKRYDMIIDLNPTPIIDIMEMTRKINAIYKIGFKSIISDFFYNIQLDIPENKFIETSYERIKNILKIS